VKKNLLTILACAAAVYGMVYADLVLRARRAYLEGEKYLQWDRNPELKKVALDAELAQTQRRLMADFKAERLGKSDLEQRMILARFTRDEAFNESSVKHAYVWFQTAVELFSPPESRWVVLARPKMTAAKELWRKELQAKKIPYQDYMLE
jgi:hypothetical protein